jgi:hypothetical protein
VFSRPTYKDLHAAGLPGTVCYCSCSGQPVLEGGGAVILSRASSLMYAGNSAATWSKNITKRNAPFLTCGRSASRSFIKCLMRWVIPRDESKRTLCLFFFFFDTGGSGSSLSTSISSALRFPLTLVSNLEAFAFWTFNTEAISGSKTSRRTLKKQAKRRLGA